MKKALIFNGRIIQVETHVFDVSLPLFWADCPDDCDTSWSYSDGQCVNDRASTTLSDAKAIKLIEINRRCDASISELAASFPQTEVQSWDQQVREADQWALDNNASVPLIAAIASARALSLDELVTRIKVKAAAFAAASGTLIGKRQYLEDQLSLITDDTPNAVAVVENIKW